MYVDTWAGRARRTLSPDGPITRAAVVGATALALVAGAFGTAAGAAPRSAEAARNERVQVLNAWKSGGDSTKEAAAKALIGTDAQIHTFLTSELGPLVEEDGRVAVLKMLGNAARESVERRSRRCPERPTISACFLPMAGKRPIRTISASKYCG